MTGNSMNEFNTKLDKLMSALTEQRSELDRLKNKQKDALDKEKEEKFDNEINELKSQIDAINAAAQRPSDVDSKGNRLSQEYMEYRDGFLNFLRGDTPSNLKSLEKKAWGEMNLKTLTVGTGTDGGFTVPELINREIIDQVQRTSPVRRVATVTQVSTSDYKRLVNVHGAGTGWVGETDARPETVNPKFEEIDFDIGEVYANIFASQNILDDSFVDLESWIVSEATREIQLAENEAFVDGNGTNKPTGFLNPTYSTTGDATRPFTEVQKFTTGDATGFGTDPNKGDVFVDTLMGLAPGYRQNSTWAMSSLTASAVRKFKTDDGQYIWTPGLTMGNPDTLLGRPVEYFEDMPAPSDGGISVVLADWARFYEIVDRVGIRMMRDPFTAKPNVTFYLTKRVGGDVVDSKAGKGISNEA